MKATTSLAAIAALIIISFSVISAQDRPPTLVVADQVTTREFHDQITLSGRTEARVTSNIVAEVAGRVAAINAAEGNPVRKGDRLVTLDDETFQYSLDAKSAQAEQAHQRFILAEDALIRTKDLHSRDLISETALDSAQAWVNITEQEYRQLEAQRRILELDFKNCRIVAPFDGYTGRKLVDVGEWVSPGTPVFEMADVSHIRVLVDLPERYFGKLSTGADVSIRLSEQSGPPVAGKVTGISPSASSETHTFPVFIDVPNDEGRLAGGMLVRVVLSLDNKFTSLAVSKDAIIRNGDQTVVYTVADGKAVPVPVRTTSTEGKMIAVQSEQLKEGMPVVVRGNERIFPGSPVKVAGDQPPGEQAAQNTSATQQ